MTGHIAAVFSNNYELTAIRPRTVCEELWTKNAPSDSADTAVKTTAQHTWCHAASSKALT
jgi:hypothetical protein